MKKRSIVSYILLSIITCGIYFLVVSYQQVNEIESEGAPSKIPAIVILLLNLFVSAAGGALLGYAANDGLNALREKRGMPTEDNLVLWVILGVLFPLITGALIQDSMNKMIDAQNPNA